MNFLLLSAVPTAAILPIKTGFPISTLTNWYFTTSCIVFVFDGDVQHITGPNMVPCFGSSSTVMLDTFPTGMTNIISEVLFISYKLLIAPGLHPR